MIGVNRFIYTDEQMEWIKNNYSKFNSTKDATNAFNSTFSLNVSEIGLCTKASNLGCKSGKFYTEEQKKWIKENFHKYNSMNELALAYNNTFSASVNCKSINKVVCKLGLQKRDVHNYTKEEDQWIIKNFQKDTWDNLANKFNEVFNSNITGSKIRNRASSIGLKREDSHEFILNKKYSVGDEKKNGKYIRVKIKECEHDGNWNDKKANDCWTTKQRIVWEEHYGKTVPDDCQIIFLNGNTKDFSIENLYCIKKKYLPYMRNNHWFSDNPEITLTAIKWCEMMYATRED